MLTMIDNVINKVSGAVYNPWVPLLLVIAGILLTVLTKFPQFRMLKESIRVVMEKPANEEGMSSFGALMISTASRVGTGNIVGVSQAICLGGVAVCDLGDHLCAAAGNSNLLHRVHTQSKRGRRLFIRTHLDRRFYGRRIGRN